MRHLSSLMRSKPLVLITSLFILGIVFGMLLKLPPAVYILFIIGCFAGVLLTPKRWSVVPHLLLMIGIGGLRMASSVEMRPNDLRRIHFDSEIECHVSAVVQSISETARGTPKFTLRPFHIDGQSITHGSIQVYAKDLLLDIDPKDTLIAQLKMHKPPVRRNPNEFDYRDFLEQKGTYFESYLDARVPVTVHPHQGFNITTLMDGFRSSIGYQFNRYCGAPSSAILSALILGDRSEVDKETRLDFANTGVIHVLAVSGLHVGYVSLILFSMTGFLRLPAVYRSLLVILGLGFYVLLTGGAPSVTRASLMGVLLVIAGMIERKSDVFNTLAAAAFMMLVIDPKQITNIGFQLSFTAVLSIVILFPALKIIAAPIQEQINGHLSLILKPILDLFLVSLAAQLGTLPLTIFYFQKLPIISLLANLFVVPLIGLIVAVGLAFLILGWITPFFAESWGALLDVLIQFLLGVVGTFGKLSWAYISTGQIAIIEMVLLWTVLLSLILGCKRGGLRIAMASLLIWMNMLVWKGWSQPRQLEFVMLDVGQGDACLLHTPQGKTVLVDTGLRFGGRDMGRDVIAPYLQSRRWGQIDLLVLTHPHNDHIGGAEYLVEHDLVSCIWLPEVRYDSFGYQQLLAKIKLKDVATINPVAGDIDSTFAPLYLRVLAPRRTTTEGPTNINNASLVIQGFYGENSVLMTGDAEAQVEAYELAYGELAKSDILKTPHHGSRTSSTAPFIKLVNPEIALISVGKGNKFRHPAQETLRLYEAYGIHTMRTDRLGAIILKADGNQWKQENWRKNSF